ncbi:unnamed protein product [Zymoseptoria tritici ST99CH_3D7]|uniref:IQ domain-containing protein IQM6 n=1 Tax=Zymoseptoria tritici (strain ST99CH_3D7) TaxID=1276538 RepID=A0A1X7RU34_ZYMT9|nr:unnamed protein product [Zymoseptoria tritici ST99CH_3D7]
MSSIDDGRNSSNTTTIKPSDPFALPPPDVLRDLARKQDERAKAIRERRRHEVGGVHGKVDEETQAAQIIQRNYRGHRDRRALKGCGLDPSTRWLEIVKETHYNSLTRPKSNVTRFDANSPKQRTRLRWTQAGAAALRAGSDDTSEDEGEDAEIKRQRKAQREKHAKTMGIEYFLEMVDTKHRYGSNLRRYHKEWTAADTKENFFYWLDVGSGKDLDLPDRPRKRLDTEQVRYLSREERKKYLVRIDAQGRFVWDRTGKPITTSPYFRDSIDGIVHESATTPTWREVTTGEKEEPRQWPSDDSSSMSSTISTGSVEDGQKYANEEFHDAKGLAKINHLSVDTLMNHLLRKTTKKNVWIFVADTSFRLYLGIKQSGAFQHSSFLKGARVSAAGLIKIKRGQVRKLSPLSGHYAPTSRLFREFVRNLKEAGADLSRLNISRSYAVILGLESYVKVKKRANTITQKGKDILNPEEKKKREEAEMDKSQSAAREREVVQKEREHYRRTSSMSYRLKKKLGMEERDNLEAGGSQLGEPLEAEKKTTG